ncbi:ribonuclease P protein subunit p21 isoform X2 [Choloepus didactylus]|uniref:ribonuclease P protein subunit p21 isoform X2 n=1 Tax=Choloepus didactylus TaxID=27675 RepID=UPI00189CDD57|nr:ribonuclease P protein subunit p21 isoform X2 [Choloepus didactylus]
MGLSDRQQHQGPRRLLRRSVVRGLRDYASQEALRSAPECPGGGASQGAGSAGVARMAGPVKDREAFQRLNFLYQAAHCVLAQDPENQALARFYCHTEKIIAKRLVLRRDPSVKRTLCRGCSSLLIPGLTCTQRQRRECSYRGGMTAEQWWEARGPLPRRMSGVGFAGACFFQRLVAGASAGLYRPA